MQGCYRDGILKLTSLPDILYTGGSCLSRIFWEHENLSDLSVIRLIRLLLLKSDIRTKHYTSICLIMLFLFLFAGTVYWNHLRRCSDQSGSVAGQSDTNLDTGTIWQCDTNSAMTVVTQ